MIIICFEIVLLPSTIKKRRGKNLLTVLLITEMPVFRFLSEFSFFDQLLLMYQSIGKSNFSGFSWVISGFWTEKDWHLCVHRPHHCVDFWAIQGGKLQDVKPSKCPPNEIVKYLSQRKIGITVLKIHVKGNLVVNFSTIDQRKYQHISTWSSWGKEANYLCLGSYFFPWIFKSLVITIRNLFVKLQLAIQSHWINIGGKQTNKTP